MDASCANTYNEKNTTINSPNYPKLYPKNKHCTWNVAGPIGFEINVEHFSYSMDGYIPDCRYDSLKLYDDSSNRSRRVANLCYEDKFNRMISTTNDLFFVFESDDDDQKKEGFQIAFSINGM